jgi:hypothetical protein
MTVGFTTPPPGMLAYWRLDEDWKTATSFRESVNGTIYIPPAPLTVSTIVEMREIYLRLCPEGTYAVYNDTSNMQDCIDCHPSCKNCNGVKNTSCTDCNSPYKLIEAE